MGSYLQTLQIAKMGKYLLLLTMLLIFRHTYAQNPLSPVANFNILAESNVTMAGGDVEGGIAAGGNFTINGASQITTNNSGTGNTYGTISSTNYALVVGGQIVYTTGTHNINVNGSANHRVKIANLGGGTITTSGTNIAIQKVTPKIQINSTPQTSGSIVGTTSFNFATVFTTLRNTSSSLANCPNNVVPTYDVGAPTIPKITMIANTRNTWNLTSTQLASFTGITFNTLPTSTNPLIINVNAPGTFNWNPCAMAGIGRANARFVLFNFYNTTTLNIQGSQMVEGSVLAPNASIIKTNSSNIEGQVVCTNFTQTVGEIHVAHFNASVTVCNIGSVGNYVWIDTNADGIQNEPAANGINGVTVQLWKPGPDNVVGGGNDVLVATTTTANDPNGNPGYYNFLITTSTKYFVQFPTSYNSFIITNRGWNTNDDTDSDADATTGCSDVFTINVAGTGFAKNNPTIDVGYTDCMTLSNLVVGACTNIEGMGKSKVDITVNLPSSWVHGWDRTLRVSTAGQIYNILLGHANQKTISFLLPAYGQSDTIIAEIIPTSTVCSKKVKVAYTLPSNCISNPCGATGTLGGYVFKDANANGNRDQGEMDLGSGLQNVTVSAYNSVGLVAQTTTDVYGKYTFSGLSNATSYRIEFSNYPAGWLPAHNGTNNATNVQFVTTPNCAANFALAYPADYCQDNPYIIAGTYANGNPTVAGVANSGNLGWFHKWLYNEKDTLDRSTPNWGWQNHKTTIADSIFQGIKIGSVWGVTYDNKRKKAYTSAVLRRHAGYGPLGSGGIYKIDFAGATPTIANWLNFDALGIPTGNAAINNGNRGLPIIPGSPNNDPLAYDGVGKYAFGGLDISEDNNKLFVMNLYDQKLYIIDISGGGTPTLANISSIAIPQSSCTATNSMFRPWAVKYYHGKLYVGGLCSGETQPVQAGYPDMTATIYSLDPSNIAGGFTQVFTFPLTYRWFTNWHSTFQNEWESSPMLTDIEFEQDGSMILGMLDRKGYQLGIINYPPTGTNTISAESKGDILRVHNDNGTFVMENAGVSGPLVGLGSGDQEPASWNRGFFDQKAPFGGVEQGVPPAMCPASQGALALKQGSGEVITTMGDIINYNSGGVGTLSTQNGKMKKGFELFYEYYGYGKMGKAAGIGDLELMCEAAPIEVGNYVWLDLDGDGVQDPSESGIQGVDVRLYSANFTLVGKTTTNVRGEYYFNMKNVDTTGVNATTGAANTGYTGLNYNRPYYIVIGKNGQFNTTSAQLVIGANSYGLTLANTGQGANADFNDSDAGIASALNAVINGYPYIVFTSGTAGSSNHTYDFGLKTVGSVGNYVWVDVNGNGLQDDGANTGLNGVTVHLWSAGADGVAGGGDDYIVNTTTTANNTSVNPGYYNFIIEVSGNYFVQFPTSYSTYSLTTQTATAATDNNSDPNTNTGYSPVFTINIAGSGTAKDNPTIDAGYKCLTGNCLPLNVRKVN